MKIVFTGGGTLGSGTPLLAVYEKLATPLTIRGGEGELKAYWIGTRGGIERELIERSAIPFFAITAGKLRRYVDWRNFFTPIETLLGFFQALSLLRKLRPSHVLSAGGYVAVPVVTAAALLGIPSYGMQLDVRPGLANRLIAPIVKKMFVVFPETARFFSARNVVVTGSVARKMIKESPPEARNKEKSETTRPMLLVLGGGTGALSLNEIVWQSLRQLTMFCDVVHITGPGKFRHVSLPHYESYTFVKDALPTLFRNADCVVTRAGMGTLSELAALSKAAIVIPLPETHQEENAALLARHGAAMVMQQSALTPEKFIATIRGLFNDTSHQKALGEKLHDTIPTDGAAHIAQFFIHHS